VSEGKHLHKVLIITYYFSKPEQIGSMRLRGLAKFLPEFDWEPVVITPISDTPHDTETRIEQTLDVNLIDKWKRRFGIDSGLSLKEAHGRPKVPYKNRRTLIDFALMAWEDAFAYPDVCSGWLTPAVEAGNALLRTEKFDAIISSSSPVTCHLIAAELKREHNIPWIADLRDLWTQNHYYHHTPIRKLVEMKLERDILASADRVTTVSDPLSRELMKIHGNERVQTIHNGFDPTERQLSETLSSQFRITHTGSLYRGRRDPDPLFRALKELIEEGRLNSSDIKLAFVGETEEWLTREVEKYSFEDIVSVVGRVPRDEALRMQKESQILLLLTWNDPRETGVYTGKLFEYLASMRPILSIGPKGSVVDDLLRITQTGRHVSTVEQTKDALVKWHAEFMSMGRVKYRGVEGEVDRFSHREMARKFAHILNEIHKPEDGFSSSVNRGKRSAPIQLS